MLWGQLPFCFMVAVNAFLISKSYPRNATGSGSTTSNVVAFPFFDNSARKRGALAETSRPNERITVCFLLLPLEVSQNYGSKIWNSNEPNRLIRLQTEQRLGVCVCVSVLNALQRKKLGR